MFRAQKPCRRGGMGQVACMEGLEGRQLMTAVTAVASAENLGMPSGSSEIVNVTYADAAAPVRADTLGDGDVVVAGPNGYSQMGTFIGVDPAANDGSVTAHYFVAPPTGGWTAAADGRYSIQSVAGEVTDANGGAIGDGEIGAFNVNIPGRDTTAPVASLSGPEPVFTLGAARVTMTLTLSDDVAVNAASITPNAVTVRGPSGQAVAVTMGDVNLSVDGKTATAVFTLAAPSGTFGMADDGAYAINVNTEQLSDQAGNTAGAIAAGSFEVAITEQTPVVADPIVAQPAEGPDLVGEFSKTPVDWMKPGGKTTLHTRVVNIGTATATGKVRISYFLSSDDTLDANDLRLTTSSAAKVSLKAGAGKTFNTSVKIPKGMAGDYFVLGVIDSGNGVVETNEQNNVTAGSEMLIEHTKPIAGDVFSAVNGSLMDGLGG